MFRNCPICPSDFYQEVYKNIVQCNSCGMSYRVNVKSQEELDKYYAEMSKYEIEEGTELDIHFKKHANNLYDFIKENITLQNLNILDIGCSNGYFLNKIKYSNLNCDLLGIDPSKKCVVNTLKKGINAEQATIDTFNSKDKHYNLVCLSAVLEHVVSPRETIKKIADMQKYKDYLIIVVPDLNMFSSYVEVPFQQFNTEHINYFRLQDIEKLLFHYGYKIISTGTHLTKRTSSITEPDLFILAEKQDNIFDYVKESKNREQEIIKRLKEKLRLRRIDNLIVWGAGECSKWLFDAAPWLIENIVFFVDNDKRLNKFLDKEVFLPEKTLARGNLDPILIASMAHADEIEKQIIAMGLTNKVIKL